MRPCGGEAGAAEARVTTVKEIDVDRCEVSSIEMNASIQSLHFISFAAVFDRLSL